MSSVLDGIGLGQYVEKFEENRVSEIYKRMAKAPVTVNKVGAFENM
jgi:hypothetical protein